MNDRLLRAARRQPTDTTPVWLMRQAGRYLPEYRAIRGNIAFLDLCKHPDLAAEVTVQPVTRLGVDAAIIFSDILIPVEAMGIVLELGDKGPHFPNPVRTAADIDSCSCQPAAPVPAGPGAGHGLRGRGHPPHAQGAE